MPSGTQSGAQTELALAVDRTLLAEARENEARLASVRFLALLLMCLGDWIAFADPGAVGFSAPHLRMPLASSACTAASLAVLLLLRRGVYPGWWRLAFPVADALLLAGLGFNYLAALGPDEFARLQGPTAVGLGAALLIGASGLRMSRRGTAVVTVLACAIYAAIVGGNAAPPQIIYHAAILVGIGMLSTWMVGVAERATRSKVGRLMLGRFLPERVIQGAHRDPLSLLTQPSSSEATILISDLRDFTAFAERLPPTEVLGHLNEIQGAFAAIVRQHGGAVDKFMGDGMLAVFGAPDPLPGHAGFALDAAKEMRRALATINAAHLASGKSQVKVGIGIHSGMVVTGCLGAAERLEFTVIGDTVNTASRLEALTKQHGVEVIVSEDTRARLPAEAAKFRPLGEVTLRGRTTALQVFALEN